MDYGLASFTDNPARGNGLLALLFQTNFTKYAIIAQILESGNFIGIVFFLIVEHFVPLVTIPSMIAVSTKEYRTIAICCNKTEKPSLTGTAV